MHHFTTDEIITGIAGKKNNVIKYIYATCYDSVRKLILMNKGNDEDVRDVFQEALFTIYQKIMLQRFQIKCNFSTYIYSVCRFIWIRELSKKIDYEDMTDEFPDLTVPGTPNQQFEL